VISIIIVNYLQKDFLEKCVQSTYKNLNPSNFEIIIVNNSEEDDLSTLKTSYPQLTILENQNTGYAKANNLAVKHSKGEFLLFLNADTEILNDFTEDLINNFKNREFGAVGLKLQYQDGSFQNSFGLFPTVHNEYKNRKTEHAFKRNDKVFINNLETAYSQIKSVEWVTGAALFMRKKTFEKINGFDERFFLFYEDIDLCCRLHKAGYENFYYPFSKIIHHKGEYTRDSTKDKLRQIQNASQRLFYKIHTSITQQIIIKIYQFFKELFK
jgi:GT2 family glycosyltransferase